MSEDVLSVIPTDPHWQPGREAGERAAALVTRLSAHHGAAADDLDADEDPRIDVDWYPIPTAVDCGGNLHRIGCPHCGAPIDREWYADLVEHHPHGFPTLAVTVPCCAAGTSLDALDYDWPCGFARFEIAVWNPGRLIRFGDDELSAVAETLGHPVRQIRAHI
ncbi:hypothetical protein [Streptomyces sp. MBT53]|uniref:hypothetical protein n=1 Tax=Streptomyces sp. MBT53 TaxID=1488384 RepID=UPI0019139892|nr:hypothetical protein [Streptomyces sp. MBT53]MBK6016011.1 hypothetical protein [Streptomyces sp. MBT53]